MIDTLEPPERDVLETIDRYACSHFNDVFHRSGWGYYRCLEARAFLRRTGLIERTSEGYQLTESGKIILAVLRGQEVRRRKIEHRAA